MENLNEYIDGRNRIFDAVSAKKLGSKEINTHRFNLVSANLFKFLPRIDFKEHESIYKEITLHNQLSHFEQLYLETFNFVTPENLTPELMTLLREKPCIMSSFHFGTYRLLNIFLIKNKIPYTIVVPKAILEKEGDILRKIYANGDSWDDPKFIEVESPALGLKMIKELKKGRSLFIYFDGNRGSGDIKHSRQNESDGKINFFDQTIFARKGVAYLAHAANVPLITAISYRRSLDDIRLHFFEPIFPEINRGREIFAQETTQTIYNRFSPFLKEYPGQWEGWLYLHKSIDCDNMMESPLQKYGKSKIEETLTDKFSLNLLSYGVFRIEENSFLFDKNTYKTYPIDALTYGLLSRSSEEYIDSKEFTDEIFLQLFRNNALASHPSRS